MDEAFTLPRLFVFKPPCSLPASDLTENENKVFYIYSHFFVQAADTTEIYYT